MVTNVDFARAALSAQGIRYVLGAKWGGGPWPPRALDCSGLVAATSQRLGLRYGVGLNAAGQWAAAKAAGTAVTAAEAATTPGVLCFRVGVTATNHVAITLGENKTMEARSSHTTPQVGVFGAMTSRRWTGFARVPGVTYRGAPAQPPPAPVPPSPPAPQPSPTDEEDDEMTVDYIRHPNGAIARFSNNTYALLATEEQHRQAAVLDQLKGRAVSFTAVTVEQWALFTSLALDITAINAAVHGATQ